MKNKIFCLFLILVTPAAFAGNAVITLLDGFGNPVPNEPCILVGASMPQSQNGGTAVKWRSQATSDTNGVIILTNAAPGVWQVSPNDENVLQFSFLMPVTNGVVYVQNQGIAAWDSTLPAGQVAYDTSTSDRRYASPQQVTNIVESIGGGGTNTVAVTNSNPTVAVATTNNVAYVSAVPSAIVTSATIGSAGGVSTNSPSIPVMNLNPILWVDPQRIAATDGQTLTTVPDVSGNGNTLFNGTATPVFYSATVMNGLPGIMMPADWNPLTGAVPTTSYALTNGVWITNGVANMNSNSSITITFKDLLERGGIGDGVLLNGGQILILCGVGVNNNCGIGTYDANLGSWSAGNMYIQYNPLMNQLNRPAIQLNHNVNVLTVRQTAGLPDVWLNGVPVDYTNAMPNGPFIANANLFILGNEFSGGVINPQLGAWDGAIGDVVVTTNSPSNQQLAALQQYLMNKYNVASGVGIYLIGDSITHGLQASQNSNFCTLVQSAYPNAYVSCQAYPGMTTASIYQDITNGVGLANCKVPGTTKKVVVYMAGANDIDFNGTLAFAETNILNSVTAFHNANCAVILCTLPSLLYETGHVFTRMQLNAFIRTLAGIYPGVTICDYGNDPEMGPNGSYNTHPELYFSDQIHPTGNAYNLLDQNELFPALNLVLGNVGASGGISAGSGDVSFAGSGTVATTVNSVGGTPAATVSTGAALANAATAANTPSALVARDGSGNFVASVITAALNGNAATATSASFATSAASANSATIATTAANLSGALAAAANGKGFPFTNFVGNFPNFANVMLFGAKGDGITDDAPAINAGDAYLASIGGGVLWFPSTDNNTNHYKIASPIILPPDGGNFVNLKWAASSPNLVIIQPSSAFINNTNWGVINGYSFGEFEVEGLGFMGAGNTNMIAVSNTRLFAHNCYFGIAGGSFTNAIALGGPVVGNQLQGYEPIIFACQFNSGAAVLGQCGCNGLIFLANFMKGGAGMWGTNPFSYQVAIIQTNGDPGFSDYNTFAFNRSEGSVCSNVYYLQGTSHNLCLADTDDDIQNASNPQSLILEDNDTFGNWDIACVAKGTPKIYIDRAFIGNGNWVGNVHFELGVWGGLALDAYSTGSMSNLNVTGTAYLNNVIISNSITGNGGGLTNLSAATASQATNVVNLIYNWNGGSNTLSVFTNFQYYAAVTNTAISNILGAVAGQVLWTQLEISNSTAYMQTSTFVGWGTSVGQNTSNPMYIPAGHKGIWEFWTYDLHQTNFMNMQ